MRNQLSLLGGPFLVAALLVSAQANAQSTCTSSTQTCYYGDNTGGNGLTSISGNSHKGVAVYGNDNNNGQGVEGQSSTGQGVVGTSNASLSSPANTNIGVYGSASESTGFNGPVGVYGTTGNLGTGVVGVATGSGGHGVSGTATAGVGVTGTDTSSGDGVYGTTSTGWGVYGNASGSAGYGVGGYASGGGSDIGVYGSLTGSTGLAAVYGYDGVTTGTHWAGYFDGAINTTHSIWFSGTCYYPCTSDQRLKQNIKPLAGALVRLLQLKGVTYEWKAPADQGEAPGIHTGFIAQDVERVFPNWVGENEKGFKVLGIPPREIAALQVEAIREQQAEIDDLKAEVRELKDARRPLVSLNPWWMGMAGLLIGCAVYVSRRKRADSER